VWGKESLEIEKAHGDLLGERATAEAVGWVGSVSPSQWIPISFVTNGIGTR